MEAMVDDAAVVLLSSQVEVLPLVGVVVVELQSHQVGHVVVGSEAHVPAQPGCTPASSIYYKYYSIYIYVINARACLEYCKIKIF